MLISNIRVILVETSHPGNIGAAARAIKNMGLSRLYLVRPERFPAPEAVWRASRADDILEQAVVVETLDEALKGCHMIVGTSARLRVFQQPMLDPHQLAEKLVRESDAHTIAIIFGPEESGLTNDILRRCHYHVSIPAVKNYSSLNLAAAVQVIAYEIRMAVLASTDQQIMPLENPNLPTAEEMEGLYQHIESTMIEVGFLNPKHPRRMMPRIRRLFGRARIDQDDLDLLRGMMAAIQKYHTRR